MRWGILAILMALALSGAGCGQIQQPGANSTVAFSAAVSRQDLSTLLITLSHLHTDIAVQAQNQATVNNRFRDATGTEIANDGSLHFYQNAKFWETHQTEVTETTTSETVASGPVAFSVSGAAVTGSSLSLTGRSSIMWVNEGYALTIPEFSSTYQWNGDGTRLEAGYEWILPLGDNTYQGDFALAVVTPKGRPVRQAVVGNVFLKGRRIGSIRLNPGHGIEIALYDGTVVTLR